MFIFQLIRCLNVFRWFLDEKGSINSVHTQLGGGWGRPMQNAYSCVRREELSRLMCTYALTVSLLMILGAFLSYSALFYLQIFNLILFKKDVFVRNGYFSPKFWLHEITLFYLKLFLRTKFSQNALISIK